MTRAEAFEQMGILGEILWHERYPEEYPGEFERQRQKLESESLEAVMDRWCRGQNLVGYAESILRRVKQIRHVVEAPDGQV